MIVILDTQAQIVDLYTSKSGAGRKLGINSRTIFRHLKNGKLIKGRWKVTEQEVNKIQGRELNGINLNKKRTQETF